ncbi:aspartate/glutamate racemase family protein [Methylobacterium iners]|uniref:Aspartate racemase n=1 Tax=Methylobacterium iners TaxID=418707 RepID=A0ABQ4S2U0_9HYPH|nr:amino acid racemase [Methylobacterium iners]GJD97346.1 Aspartate racemase [Methylobacterium iners]
MLGVLGGMGALATVDFLGKLVRSTPAMCDQDHIPMIVRFAPSIPDRTAAILEKGPDPLPGLREAAVSLEKAGATSIAIPCNTAHFWHPALQAQTSVPILHIADAVVDALPQHCFRNVRIGLLATSGTLSAGIYQERLARGGFVCRLPNEKRQTEIMRAIRFVKAGQLAASAVIMQEQLEDLLEGGCHYVVMACTEIPLALTSCGADYKRFLIDSTEALVGACLKLHLSRTAQQVY